MTDHDKKRSSVKPEEGLSISEILKIEVPDDRVERLKKLTRPDAAVSDEVHSYLVRLQAQWTNIQYTRFLAGAKYTEQDVDEILTNSIDTHVHGGSDPFERLLLEDDIAYDFTDSGCRALVFKTWYTPSASRNALVRKLNNRYAEERGLRPAQVFGGVTLNYPQGGFNPDAVRKCLGFPGMKYVWMPMVDSYHHRRVVYDDWSGYGLSFLDENRKLLPEVREILKIVAANDLVLASGHYPFEDTHLLFQEARMAGVNRLEVIHPAHIHSKHSIEQMRLEAELGAKLMVSGLGAQAFPLHESGPLYAARQIKEVGAENCIYGSDYDQLQNPPPITANRWMIKLLLSYGCTAQELYQVFQVTPAEHLGLEPPPPLGTPAHPGWPPHSQFRHHAGHPQGDPQARDRAHNRWAPTRDERVLPEQNDHDH
ncbi:MAG TPA: DUF6282 family protein [Candidatus Dormibacteraeota bacterium]|nr:DUF6282 family protein [Candidatus Dormibacteraeota bacterium]